jgi:hypothetical protein
LIIALILDAILTRVAIAVGIQQGFCVTSSSPIIRVLLGFAAACLSVALFHQTVIYALSHVIAPQWVAWSTAPVGPYAAPAILNKMFWGGLWGALFAVIWRRLPGPSLPAKGAIFALVGPLLIGRWIVVPTLKSQPIFADFEPVTVGAQIFVQIAFGAGLGWIYGLLSGERA